ncbi:hypothetical protein ACFLRF_01200 [Candidatus Altiarchaeota archaeon]
MGSISDRSRSILLILLLLSSALLYYFVHEALINEASLTIHDVLYSRSGSSYRFITLPYMRDPGKFIINISSSDKDVILFSRFCIKEVHLDGISVYEGGCEYPADSGLKLEGILSGDPERIHSLHVVTYSKKHLFYRKLFYLRTSSSGNLFKDRLLVISSFLILTSILVLNLFPGKAISRVSRLVGRLRLHQGIIVLLLLTVMVQYSMFTDFKSVDLWGWTVWTEGLIQKHDLDVMHLPSDYDFSYTPWGYAYMNKPPGAYLYWFIALRLLFGFNYVYMHTLTGLVGALGHLLLGALIYVMLLDYRVQRRLALIGAGLYLLNPTVLMQTTILCKSDSMCLFFLLLAIRNKGKWRFPIYYAIAITCKQSALLILPWFIVREKDYVKIFSSLLVAALICSPFIVSDPVLFFTRLTDTHLGKDVNRQSWMSLLPEDPLYSRLIIDHSLTFFFVLMVVIAFLPGIGCLEYSAIVYSLFVVLTKSLHYQYFFWTFPFMLILYLIKHRRSYFLTYFVASLMGVFIQDELLGAPEYRKILLITVNIAYLAMIIDALIKRD